MGKKTKFIIETTLKEIPDVKGFEPLKCDARF